MYPPSSSGEQKHDLDLHVFYFFQVFPQRCFVVFFFFFREERIPKTLLLTFSFFPLPFS